MPASVVQERSEVAFVEASVGPVEGYGVDSGAVCAEDSRARVLAVISLKIYTQTTLAPTNNRPVGYGWMDILAHLRVLPLSSVVGVAMAVASMQSPANK